MGRRVARGLITSQFLIVLLTLCAEDGDACVRAAVALIRPKIPQQGRYPCHTYLTEQWVRDKSGFLSPQLLLGLLLLLLLYRQSRSIHHSFAMMPNLLRYFPGTRVSVKLSA